jgi:Amt family ammonium transporter
VAALSFWIIGKLVGNRVSAEDEVSGLDLPEMGVIGYSADAGPGGAGVAHAQGGASHAAAAAGVAGR